MNRLLACAGVLGLISVIMGAMGDHAFALTRAQAESFDTAVRYNMIYAVLAAGIALTNPIGKRRLSGFLFAGGAALFAGSIYLSLVTGISGLTYLTPFGGLTLMAGWVVLILSAFGRAGQRDQDGV